MSLLNKNVVFETAIPVQVIGEVVSEGENGVLVRMTSIAPLDKHTWVGAAHLPQLREVPEEDTEPTTDVGSQPGPLTDEPGKVTKLTGPNSVHTALTRPGTLDDQPVASSGDSESLS